MNKGCTIISSVLVGLMSMTSAYAEIMSWDKKIYDWTGFYAGGSIGGEWAKFSGPIKMDSATVGAVVVGPYTHQYEASANSLTGGGQFGYNLQKENIVLGGEVTIQAQRFNALLALTHATSPFAVGDEFTSASNVQSAVLGRLGYAANKWFFYGTAGLGFVTVQFKSNFIATSNGGTVFPASYIEQRRTLIGGVGGLGAEYSVFENWRIGIELRYSGYRKERYDLGTTAAHQLAPAGFLFLPTRAEIDMHHSEALFKVNYQFT